ncbi:MAG: malonate transporter [Gammaproteobacteria bacterium]|jgi:malonate transporter
MDGVGLSVILPFFAIMVAGYLVGKFRLLPNNASEVLSRFVFVIAMPALIFIAVSKVSTSDFFNGSFIAALGGGMAFMFVLGLVVDRWVFKGDMTSHAFHGLALMFSSTAYIGLPLLLTLFGDEALAPGIIGAVITGTLFAPITILIAELSQGNSYLKNPLLPFTTALTRPPMLATVAGLLVSTSGYALPDTIIRFCEVLGSAFVPCALLSAGLFISSCQLKSTSTEIGWMVFAKLIIHPAITWYLAFHVFELEGILPVVAVIQAALPCGIPVFVLAQQYNSFVVQSSSTIAWSTALSVLTISALLILLEV